MAGICLFSLASVVVYVNDNSYSTKYNCDYSMSME